MLVAKAPLRIPLGGGGTDFPSYYLSHGGYILGFALDKYVHVVVHPTNDGVIHLKYSKAESSEDIDALDNRVAAEALKWFGWKGGVEIATFSDVPESSGLGGSSAFCVALVKALDLLTLKQRKRDRPMDRYEVFAAAWDIERNKAGQPGGMQDQFFASFGGAWKVDLGETFSEERLDDLVGGLLPFLRLVYVADRSQDKSSFGIAQAQIDKTECSDGDMLGNLGKVKEHGKCIEAALAGCNYVQVGRLFHQHWENKKRRDPSISTGRIDEMYSKCRESGVLGGKLLGLGGGGYLLLFCTNGFQRFSTMNVGLDRDGAQVVYQS